MATATPRLLCLECAFTSRHERSHLRDHLWAEYHVGLGSISDDHTPHTASAHELLAKWAKSVATVYPSGIVPIQWSVRGAGILEVLPGLFDDDPGGAFDEDFLTFYSWPKRVDTGERLRWIDLPVRDLQWKPSRADTGGFIQEATGWRPSVLQPFVLADHLFGFHRTSEVRGAHDVWEFVKSVYGRDKE